MPDRLQVPQSAVRALRDVFTDECELPYMARIRDWTTVDGVDDEGLRAATQDADEQNDMFLRKLVAAACGAVAQDPAVIERAARAHPDWPPNRTPATDPWARGREVLRAKAACMLRAGLGLGEDEDAS